MTPLPHPPSGGFTTPAVLGTGRQPYDQLGALCFDLASAEAGQFVGRRPVIAHPPRHAFARLRHASAGPARRHERELSLWALDQVRSWGGVLEHPAHSALWADAGLPGVGDARDRFGGWTLPVWLSWFGGATPRPTWLYLVGYDLPQIPAMPLQLAGAGAGPGGDTGVPEAFARWLIGLAVTIGQAQAWRYDVPAGCPC